MAKKPNKTEQGRQERSAEKAARAKATQGRRDSAAAAQSRSEQREGRNVDEGSAGRVAGFSAREANAGLTLAGNDTTAGRDDFYSNLSKPQASWASFDSGEMKAGSEMEFKSDVPSGGGGLAGIEIIWADQTIEFIEAADLTDTYDDEAYWSLVLTVSSGSFDKTLAYDATPDIFTTTGTAPNEVQTKYRLRLITQYTNGNDFTILLCFNGSVYGLVYIGHL